MKKYISATIIFVTFFNVVSCQTTNKKFRIEKIKYVNENGFLNITFNIVNLGKDTLYLNHKRLIIKFIKNKNVIRMEYPKVDVQPFIKPILKNGEQIQISTIDLNNEDPKEKSATYFANKLYLKNIEINNKLIKYRNQIIQSVKDDCIVLYPSEIYEYETYLFSKKVDKTCKVSVKYSDSKIFTCFVDDNGKKTDINN